MVQFSSGVCWCGVLVSLCVGCFVCGWCVVAGVCCFWLLFCLCLCWFWCVLVGPLFFWLVVVVVLLCPLFCSWWCCGCWCVSPPGCFSCALQRPGVGCSWFVCCSSGSFGGSWFGCFSPPLFHDLGCCGPAPGLTQNATWLGWLCGVSASGGYASGWLCAIQLVRLLRASLVSSLPVRPSVVRVSCRYSRFSAVYLCATASRLICPSSCLFAFIVATRFSPPGVVRLSCRWQSALICSLFMLFVGYVVNVARGFFLLACLQCIHFLLFLYRFSSFSANHQLAP